MYYNIGGDMLRWSEEKNRRLKRERGVSFEEALGGEYLGLLAHPARKGQYLLLLLVHGYVWVAPCVAESEGWFLKTLFPSRKYTALLKKGKLL
jgi:hypothetical protein